MQRVRRRWHSGNRHERNLDVPGYLRAATNQETASLLGLNTTLGGTATVAAGVVSLPVATATGWTAGPLWLLDGPWSEVAQVTGSADSTHLTLAAPGTRWSHTPGISVSQAGTAGSLAGAVLRASAWIEGYCQQGTPAARSTPSAGQSSGICLARAPG